MTVNGTLINYYFHCKRQCYLHGNRLNLEDNSEAVKIGKAVHEEREEKAKNAELQIENIKIDALTDKYLVEIKKSDCRCGSKSVAVAAVSEDIERKRN